MAAQIKPKLDVYLRYDNVDNEVISGPEDMYIDDEYENNIRQILCENSLTVNHSVIAESVEDMLYLDVNSSSHTQSKRQKKESLLIESENEKPKKRLRLHQKQLKDEAKMTYSAIKKSQEENDNIEINSNFPIHGKLKPLYKGILILEKNKE